MASLNEQKLIGNLTRDAELREAGGTHVLKFSLATNDVYKDRDGQKKEDVQFHNCVLWGKLATSLAQYLVKGKQVYVSGKTMHSKYQAKDGTEKFKTEVKVFDIKLLGSRGDSGAAQSFAPKPQTIAPQSGPDFEDDDIPF